VAAAGFKMTRITEREQIVIPEAPSGHWIITAPRLKLAIKYGVLGGERTANPSVAFDAYALGRGPKAGIPTIADFAMTVVMNSNVTGADISGHIIIALDGLTVL